MTIKPERLGTGQIIHNPVNPGDFVRLPPRRRIRTQYRIEQKILAMEYFSTPVTNRKWHVFLMIEEYKLILVIIAGMPRIS